MDSHLENYTNVNIFKRVYEHKHVGDSQDMIEHSHNHTSAPNALSGNQQRQGFNPYTNNMGTTLGKSISPLLSRLIS
jgi:hypothetical protein